MPFPREKSSFFILEAKKGKEKQKIKTKQKERKTNKTQKIPKMSFSVISQFFLLFLVGVQNFPFLTTWPKSAHPRNTIKIGVSARHFLKTRYASRNGHFWTKIPNPEIPEEEERERESDRERERERECVCVCKRERVIERERETETEKRKTKDESRNEGNVGRQRQRDDVVWYQIFEMAQAARINGCDPVKMARPYPT